MSETTNSVSMELFDQGIAFEALKDSLNSEIARHMAALRSDPSGSEAGLHDMAVDSLVEARQHLNPDNPEAIKLATLIMRSYRDKVPQEAR